MITWHELFTDDVDKAVDFYTGLLDAEIETAPMEGFDYKMLKWNGQAHAGFVPKPEEDMGAPNHWYGYVGVDDTNASAEKAKSLGAQVYHEGEVPDMLRFAVLGDPQHATFGVLQSLGQNGGDAPSGLFVWDELHSAEPDAEGSFYSSLFGWSVNDMMEGYRSFNEGETMVGGLAAEQGGSPGAYWLSYLGVGDVDASAAKATSLGATQMMAPTDIEGVGRFSVLTDPTGAAFGLFTGGPQS
jgi:predicted enzyme related to lactoylglutathione lyase